jgi:hypothetical protein
MKFRKVFRWKESVETHIVVFVAKMFDLLYVSIFVFVCNGASCDSFAMITLVHGSLTFYDHTGSDRSIPIVHDAKSPA